MPTRKWVRHPETGATKEVAASAVPVLASSGWAALDDAEVEQLHTDRRAEKAAAEAAMTPDRTEPAPVEAPVKPSPRPKRPGPAADQTAGTTEKES